MVVRGDVRYAKDDTNSKDRNAATRTAKKTAAPAKRPTAKQAIVPAKTPRKATPKAKTTNEANAYKDFLAYAITGTLEDVGNVTGRSPDSPFEVAVCRQIDRLGLEAVPQVGVAGFFIDIGVRRREGDRSFVLGIECDGATYHSARSARDRDRLREEIIRSRGWQIHRIWSTDWFLDQGSEVRRLEAAIAAAIDINCQA